MNSSVPGAVSPPLIMAAAARMPTITTTIAQNSVVLNACFVSVDRRRTALRPADRSTLAPAPRFRVVAASMVFLLFELPISQDRRVPGRDSQRWIQQKALECVSQNRVRLGIRSKARGMYPALPMGNGPRVTGRRTPRRRPGRGEELMEAPRFELGSADAVRGCLQV